MTLGACAPPSPLPAAPSSPAFPDAYYRQLEAAGKSVLRVRPDRSLVVLEVRRGGPFARFGHDHVVASHDVSGFVAPGEGRADLMVPLARLTVDEPALRTAAGFEPQPPADAVDGTRRNMLERVLEVERYPFALIRITRADAAQPVLAVAITLHGATRTFDVPAQVEEVSDGIVVSGRMAFNQSDFGIVPFAVLNGALQVQDRLALRFRVVAARP